MPARPSSPARLALLSVLAAAITGGAAPAETLAAGSSPLTILERSIDQDQGGWRVEYRLRHEGASGIVVTPAEILAKVEGWVSNSRVAAHAVPRWSSVVVSGPSGLSGCGDVVTSADDSQRCRERVAVQVWTGDEAPPDSAANARASGTHAVSAEPPAILSLAPAATVRVRLRLEHQHFLFGDYDPLLGNRTLELHLGSAVLRDAIPMDREQYLAQPRYAWPAPPEDRRDTRHFMSAPDSLHLEAHIPGNQHYRFPERPVRYATKMRLRFWYLVAPGTEGECRARIAQYKDTPTAWKILTEGGHDFCLKTVGRWTKVERVFRTEADATTLALEFQIGGGAEVGEMWIDDISLEPVGFAPAGP